MHYYLDIEVYPNLFFCCIQRSDGDRKVFHLTDRRQLRDLLQKRSTIGFNSLNYDVPILWGIATGVLTSEKSVYDFSCQIIRGELTGWQARSAVSLPSRLDHIDLIEPAPGVGVSLKLYGGRMAAHRLQDLPLDPTKPVPEDKVEALIRYCWNDVETTALLHDRIRPRIALRESISQQIGVDVRSKSDAQVAEAIFKSQLGDAFQRPVVDPDMTWQYSPPAYLNFQTPELQELLDLIRETEFRLTEKMAVKLPSSLANTKLVIGDSTYRLGIGGIHSSEKNRSVVPDSGWMLSDFDVTSYYPSIISELGLYPEHLGERFLTVYRDNIIKRNQAKKRMQEIEQEIAALEKELKGLDKAKEILEEWLQKNKSQPV